MVVKWNDLSNWKKKTKKTKKNGKRKKFTNQTRNDFHAGRSIYMYTYSFNYRHFVQGDIDLGNGHQNTRKLQIRRAVHIIKIMT